MGTPTASGRSRWLVPGIVASLLLAGVISTLVLPAEEASYVGFGMLVLGLSTAAILTYRRSSTLRKGERIAWRFVGGGAVVMGVGVLTIGVVTALGIDVPAFGPIDAFFLVAYALIIVGVYRMTRLDSGGHEWVLTILDTLVGGIALSALIWTFLFHDLMEWAAGVSTLQTAIAVVYPVFDLMLIMAVLMLVMRRSQYHLDLRLVFLALGAVFQVMGDLSFLRDGLGQSFEIAQPAWGLNLMATIFLVMIGAVVDVTPRRREFPEGPTPIWAVMWPYLPAAWLLGLHFQTYHDINQDTGQVLLLDALVIIGAVIFMRQVYVIYRDRNKVDRKRSELVASVSHELRTPLTAMVGFLTLLDEHAEEFPAEARQEMIGEAADQARHMSRLVSDLLMLAKGDTSKMSLRPEDVSAMAVVLSVLRATDPGTTRIIEDLQADTTVRVDPDRMKQALANLINNAVRYGGDTCLVISRIEGRDLVFEVHDNGDGVPTRFEALIWEHFERGAHRLDAVTPGLGIGLSIVQAVMDTHGGTAEYRQSERLGGACFALTIPGVVVDPVPPVANTTRLETSISSA